MIYLRGGPVGSRGTSGEGLEELVVQGAAGATGRSGVRPGGESGRDDVGGHHRW